MKPSSFFVWLGVFGAVIFMLGFLWAPGWAQLLGIGWAIMSFASEGLKVTFKDEPKIEQPQKATSSSE